MTNRSPLATRRARSSGIITAVSILEMMLLVHRHIFRTRFIQINTVHFTNKNSPFSGMQVLEFFTATRRLIYSAALLIWLTAILHGQTERCGMRLKIRVMEMWCSGMVCTKLRLAIGAPKDKAIILKQASARCIKKSISVSRQDAGCGME